MARPSKSLNRLKIRWLDSDAESKILYMPGWPLWCMGKTRHPRKKFEITSRASKKLLKWNTPMFWITSGNSVLAKAPWQYSCSWCCYKNCIGRLLTYKVTFLEICSLLSSDHDLFQCLGKIPWSKCNSQQWNRRGRECAVGQYDTMLDVLSHFAT